MAKTKDSGPGKIKYKFIVDGQWITYPANNRKQCNGPDTYPVLIVD